MAPPRSTPGAPATPGPPSPKKRIPKALFKARASAPVGSAAPVKPGPKSPAHEPGAAPLSAPPPAERAAEPPPADAAGQPEDRAYTALDGQVDAYLRFIKVERDLAKNTQAAYANDLADFVGACLELGLRDAAEVQTEHVSAWARGLAQQGLAKTSQKRMLVAVRGFFRYLRRRELVEGDPTHDVALPKLGRRLPQTLSLSEVQALLRAAGADPRDQALVALWYGAGLRVSESVGLELGEVYLDAGLLRVQGKGDKTRVLPIAQPVIDALQTYIDQDRPRRLKGGQSPLLFPSRGKLGHLTRQAAFLRLRKLAVAAGIPKLLSPHKLRHAFATHLVQGGADLRSVQVLLGHADLGTTEIYTHVDPQHVRRSYDRSHPRS